MNKVPVDCYVNKDGILIIRIFEKDSNNSIWFKYHKHWFWGPRFIPVRALDSVILEMQYIGIKNERQ